MKNHILQLVAVFFLAALMSCDSKKSSDSVENAEEQNEEAADNIEKRDSEFSVEAADAGIFEVQVGTLARDKATSPRVREFAQMMIDDHAKGNNELKALAGGKGIALPDVMCEDCQKKYYDLDQHEKGEEFDKEYIDLMVKDHKDVIDKFEDQADRGDDTELKSWAAGKLAALRHHLKEAENIQESLKQTSKR